MKQMLMVMAMLAVMVADLAAPAMAQTVVRDHRDGGGEAAPIVRDHRDDSTSTVEEEPQVVCIKAPCPGSSDSSAEEEEPYKDPGIRQCDITPVECEDTQEQQEDEEPYKDPGIRQCDITPVECEGTDESRDSEVVRDHRDGGSTDEEAASAPGGVKVGVNNPSAAAPKEALSAPADEAGQAANSGITYDVCWYDDSYYDEELGMCVPKGMAFGVLFGDEPWPDSVGGYVGLLGDFVEDPLRGMGLGLQAGLGYVGDTLVEFGEFGGPYGWAIQGIGYGLGFIGETTGPLLDHVGHAVGAAADGVGAVVDAVGEAAGAVWDEISSWW